MLNNMEKTVKCNSCGQHFMHPKTDLKCPFCHTKYVKPEGKAFEEKTKDRKEEKKEDRKEEKKDAVRTPKKSFHIWKEE